MVRVSRPISITALAVGAVGLIAAAVLLSQTAALSQLVPTAHHAAAAQPVNEVNSSASGQSASHAPKPAPVVTTVGAQPVTQPAQKAQPVDRCTAAGTGAARALPLCAPAAPQP
jgi:hypothetical protein